VAIGGILIALGLGACDAGDRSEADSFYDPPDGAPYAAEEVTIKAADGRVLAGTLTLPEEPGPARRS